MATQPLDFSTIEQDIEARIASFREKRNRNRSRATALVLLTACFSAVTTVLVGVAGYSKEVKSELMIISLITSSIVTVLLTIEGFFNHKKMWVVYSNTLSDFYDLQTDMRHTKKIISNLGKDEANKLIEDYYFIDPVIKH